MEIEYSTVEITTKYGLRLSKSAPRQHGATGKWGYFVNGIEVDYWDYNSVMVNEIETVSIQNRQATPILRS